MPGDKSWEGRVKVKKPEMGKGCTMKKKASVPLWQKKIGGIGQTGHPN